MTTYNTIILLGNKASLTRSEWKKFEEGDLILGIDVSPTELKRWSIEQEDEAKAELAKYECSYVTDSNPSLVFVEEYALEYCLNDDDGEFIEGSDLVFANKEEYCLTNEDGEYID